MKRCSWRERWTIEFVSYSTGGREREGGGGVYVKSEKLSSTVSGREGGGTGSRRC